MKKIQIDLTVLENEALSDSVFMLSLGADAPLPEPVAGQFAEVRVDGEPSVLLRRPISIHDFDAEKNIVKLLVQKVGAGTIAMSKVKAGDKLNTVLPLGNGFSYSEGGFSRPLLIGGGVGIAPLLYLGKKIRQQGIEPAFLLGGRSKSNLLRMSEFEKYGKVFAATEDGSLGQRGFVTDHPVLKDVDFDMIFACGPTPMMKAVARYANEKSIQCEVSLEHRMACGIGACLCCVEDTVDGNVCVCKEGPVFPIEKLKWLH